jgi:hypothetical protein
MAQAIVRGGGVTWLGAEVAAGSVFEVNLDDPLEVNTAELYHLCGAIGFPFGEVPPPVEPDPPLPPAGEQPGEGEGEGEHPGEGDGEVEQRPGEGETETEGEERPEQQIAVSSATATAPMSSREPTATNVGRRTRGG